MLLSEHYNKIVTLKDLKMVAKYRFSAVPILKRLHRSRLPRGHISETLRKNVFLFSMFRALKETQKLCAICLVRVSGCRKLEWVNVNDFMGNGRWVEGRKLAGSGWNPLVYVEIVGSPESSLSRLLWTHKNVPETELEFLLDLTAALIALELLQSKPPSKPTAVEWKRYAPNMLSLFMLWAVWQLRMNVLDAHQPISARPSPCAVDFMVSIMRVFFLIVK